MIGLLNKEILVGFILCIAIIGLQTFRFFRNRNRNHSEDKKWNTKSGNKRSANSRYFEAAINQAKAYRSAQNRENESRFFVETISLLILAATGFFIYLQWSTLEKTDQTLNKTMVNGQRAYLIVHNAKITEWTTKTNGTTLSYDVMNIGVTPAYDVRQSLYIGLKKPPVTNYKEITWTRTNDINYVGKGFALNSLEGPYLDKDKILKGSIRSSNDRLYFIGRIDYRDIFNIDHWTDFCFMYLGDPGLALSNCDYLNEADQEGKDRHP